jgi:putative spermidine/putrescine transport system substrate-binding protein
MTIIIAALMSLVGCKEKEVVGKVSDFKTWEEVIEVGKDREVTILMWGGNESINRYMDTYVADNLKEIYGITLKRIPMNAPDYLAKLLNEKKGAISQGTADLVWINAENFRTAKQSDLLQGQVIDLLPNLKQYYDGKADDLSYDSGIKIDGYEGIWGRAQLVLTYDSAIVKNPPRNFEELKAWVKNNPGRFTYPKLPDDFVGTAFVRTAYYELMAESELLAADLTEDDFRKASEPVMAYFEEISPYLWLEGTSYPATQSQLDDLFKNGEIDMTMGFEIGKSAGLVASGVYPDTVKTYVFDSGTIGNSHYLAVPFNAPESAGALLVMDFLQSPEAQIEKMNPEVWGDMPAFDVAKLTEIQKGQLDIFNQVPGALSLEVLADHRLKEMKSDYIDWIKKLWVETIAE